MTFHYSCLKMRRILKKHGTLNIVTGDMKMEGEEWVTEKCGIPLFDEKERTSGICRSCAIGWTHPNNFPVEDDD